MKEITYRIDSLEITKVRSLVWEAMRDIRKTRYSGSNSYRASDDQICWSVIELAIKKNIIPNPAIGHFSHSCKISSRSHELVASVLWELVIQGILYVDSPKDSIYNITDYGLQVLFTEKPVPHDPDGYLQYLKTEIPDIDAVIFTYIAEGINAYNHRLYLSATTAIGCASERALLLLIESYAKFLPSEQEMEKFCKRTKGRFIKVQFEEFQKSLGGQKGRIDKELLDGIDIIISGVFEILRQNRNSTGHPTGKSMPKENVFASLQVFVTYCKRIYALIDYFNRNAR